MVKIEDLKRINMLSQMPDHLLEILSQDAHLNIYGKNTRFFTVGEKINTFYMMIMGQVAFKVALNDDIDVIFENLQSGRSFGSSAVIKNARATYTAESQEPCEMITLSGRGLVEKFASNPELAYHFMIGMAGQYKRTMDKRAIMLIKTLEERPDLRQDVDDIDDILGLE